MDGLNVAQELLTLFFGLFYAASIAAASWLSGFPTDEIVRRRSSASVRRFIISFLSLNVAPVILFLWAFARCNRVSLEIFIPPCGPGQFHQLLLAGSIIALALTNLGFYRIYVGVLVLCPRSFYSDSQWKRVLRKAKEKYLYNCEELNYIWCKCRAHLLPGIVYVLAPSVLFIILS